MADEPMPGFPEWVRLRFDEKTKTVTISTSEGSSIAMNDKEKTIKCGDPHGNSIVMSADSITIKSIGNVNISAKKRIAIAAEADATIEGENTAIKAKKDANIVAGTALKLEGTTSADMKAKTGIGITAGTSLKLEGPIATVKASGTLTVDGGGMTSIKGGMVKIN